MPEPASIIQASPVEEASSVSSTASLQKVAWSRAGQIHFGADRYLTVGNNGAWISAAR